MSAANLTLESVPEGERQKIYDLVERIDIEALRKFNAWADIERDAPGATLLNVDAEEMGVYFDPGKKEFVILAEVSIGDARRVFDRTIPASIRARRTKKSKIEVSNIKILPFEA